MRCPNCGDTTFIKFRDHYECACCGEYIDNASFSAQEHGAQSDSNKQNKYQSVIDYIQMPRLNESIFGSSLDELLIETPDDPIALCLKEYLFRKDYPDNFKHSIERLADCGFINSEDEWLFPFLISHSEYKYFDSIINVLLRCGILEKYRPLMDEAKIRIEAENENYSNRPRDVFVCYSSNDINTVTGVVERLEADGNSCWYAARNMPHNSVAALDYKQCIEKAIENCSIFLVIMSKNSVLSSDVQWEIQKAAELGVKHRIEYRIDDSENSMLFKDFFDGIQWIDASHNTQYYLLIQRVYEIKHNIPSHEQPKIVFPEETAETATSFADEPAELSGNEDYEYDHDEDAESIEEDKIENEPGELDSLAGKSTQNEPTEDENTAISLFENGQYEAGFQTMEASSSRPNESLTLFYIGFCFEMGYGTERDAEKATEVYNLAESVNNGSDDHLGKFYYLLGRKYARGDFFQKDYTKAFELFSKSAQHGNGHGLCNLGICYKSGIGTEKNGEEAFLCFDRAKEMVPEEAYHQIGLCYEKGIGVRFDDEKAVECFRIASEHGNKKSMCNLGIHYYYGTGIEQNYEKAVECYSIASSDNDAIALYNLAQCYFKGTGVDIDKEKAKELFERSAGLGNKKASHFLIDNY